MAETTQARPALLANFDSRFRDLSATGPGWLRDLRRRARSRFEDTGFPTSRIESWRNTSVKRIAETAYSPAPDSHVAAVALEASALAAVTAPRIVLVDGRYSKELSSHDELPGGVIFGRLAEALERRPDELQTLFGRLDPEGHPFAALNTALFADGAIVAVPEGVRLAHPISIVHLTRASEVAVAGWPRSLVVAGRGAEASVLEWFVADGSGAGPGYLSSAVSEIHVEDNASLHHYRLQLEDRSASHVGRLHARLGRDARFVSHNFDLGASLGRLDLTAAMEGEGADCQLNGLYVTEGEQHIDNHSTLDHASPHCDSRETYRGILAGRSRAVFNGRIIVRPGAQKTDAKQSNPNLLLSREALVHTRPQLEIYADDVKCTHGATIGRLDNDALFYLRSRGVGAAEARRMLVQAFAREVVDRVEIRPLREWLEQQIGDRLRRIAGS